MSEIAPTILLSAVKEHFALSGDLAALPCEWGGTYRLTAEDGKCYVVKWLPSHVPAERIDLENAVLRHLSGKPVPITTPKLLISRTGAKVIEVGGGYLRVIGWVEGRLWHHVNPRSTDLAESLGRALGQLKSALADFTHAQATFSFRWAPHTAEWIEEHLHLYEERQRPLIIHFLKQVRNVLPSVKTLRHAVNYNDANDHNIIVSDDVISPEVRGFIDFGDVQYGPEINDLAICLAYAMQRCPDPLTIGRHVVAGYHRVHPLEEGELRALFPLLTARLLISVTFSALRTREDPDNAYWQVSDRPAWELLEQLRDLPEHLALCTFRAACGLEPSPDASQVREWLIAHRQQIHPVLGTALTKEAIDVFDWSVGSSDIHLESAIPVEQKTHDLFASLAHRGLRAGVGRYNEPRIVYAAGHYAKEGLNGPERRTIHLGIDVFMPAGTPLYAPLEGTVAANCADPSDGGYGYLLILEHQAEELKFHTLYGHNARSTLDLWSPGDRVEKGSCIAEIGPPAENGGWIPHLHFQLITHLLDYTNDFPGVANPLHRDTWLSISPDPNLVLQIDHPGVTYRPALLQQLVRRRHAVLAPNLSLSFHQPLHIVRGWKASLYGDDGIQYLDSCNNIAHVGHEHPEVVRAGQQQMSVLNTNTRYLHPAVIELAEELLETLPSRLSHIYFVNSGSEANDLALRIARAYTSRKETLVLDQAYHGITRSCLNVSPYKFKGEGGFAPPAYVSVLPLPDLYRNYPDNAGACLDDTKQVLNSGPEDGPVTLIHETLPSCAGQIAPPQEYFEMVYRAVRKQGGVCIADEVQTGLGRVGSHYWAFQLYGVVPDIVTIGKQLGNGHPVAAVAVTRKLAEAFDSGMEFFSSFGGNPVSCAVARAVIQTVREEHLMEHALTVGNFWKEALERIAEDCRYIGDVRGFGLFLGIEFSNPGSREPAPVQAKYVQRRMLDHRILTSLDGPDRNVMKLKPPLCITRHEVEYFLDIFRKVCGEDTFTAMR